MPTATSTRTNPEPAVPRAATIRDVARVAGVTAATVSRTLSGKRQGTAAVREAVFRAVEELGYRPNLNAQRLATGRAEKHVDLLSLNLDFGMDARKAQLIQNLLRARGFNAPLHAYGWGGRGDDEQRELASALRREKPRAIACDLSGLSAPALAELQQFQAEGGEVVGFGYGRGAARPWCDQVLFDPGHSMELAAQHFAALGHRRVGACFPTHTGTANERGAQFQELATQFKLEARAAWIYGGVPREAGIEYEDTGEQIARWFLELPAAERPTALFVSNDYAALRLVNELHHAGVSVPRDLSIVGHDDRPLARSAWVPLSSITHPADQIARHVVALLLERLNGAHAPARTLIVQGQLQTRQSSAPPPAN